MNKDFKNGIIGLLMFMGIILLLGFVETTIEDGKKSSYSSNRSSKQLRQHINDCNEVFWKQIYQHKKYKVKQYKE